jgi:predicted metal-binding membrane protein
MTVVATHTELAAPYARRLVAVLRRPRTLALGCIVFLAALGWLYAGLLVAPVIQAGQASTLGPGMGWFALIAGQGTSAPAWLQVLCIAPVTGAGAAPWADFALVLAMWVAMTFAMMLPTAGPMLLTYAELAETAARQREPAASPLVLAAGYLAIWLGFAVAATLLQRVLISTGLLGESMGLVHTGLAATIFIGAGLYQFSSLKRACLNACKRPFTFFFANWSGEARGVFRLGLRQGMYCLGCCWAAMLVMFAVGQMNVVWMAGLGAVMTAEKMARGTWFSRLVGVTFLALGAALGLLMVAASLPSGPMN